MALLITTEGGTLTGALTLADSGGNGTTVVQPFGSILLDTTSAGGGTVNIDASSGLAIADASGNSTSVTAAPNGQIMASNGIVVAGYASGAGDHKVVSYDDGMGGYYWTLEPTGSGSLPPTTSPGFSYVYSDPATVQGGIAWDTQDSTATLLTLSAVDIGGLTDPQSYLAVVQADDVIDFYGTNSTGNPRWWCTDVATDTGGGTYTIPGYLSMGEPSYLTADEPVTVTFARATVPLLAREVGDLKAELDDLKARLAALETREG